MPSPSICSGEYYRFAMLPRRIRIADCSAFDGLERWVNFYLALDLTPSPTDNDVATGVGAWSLGDLPVTHACQDVDDTGEEQMLVAINDRLYLLDWTRYYDEFVSEMHTPIYRRLTLGSLPSSADAADSPASYDPKLVKTFRRFTMELATTPTVTNPRVKITVQEDGRSETARAGLRALTKRFRAPIATRGLGFLVTLEHQDEDEFDPLWWTAEWDVRGPRITPATHEES